MYHWKYFWKTFEIMTISCSFKMLSPKCTPCPWLTRTAKRLKARENFMSYVPMKQKCRTSGTSWTLSELGVWINPSWQVKAHENHGPKTSVHTVKCSKLLTLRAALQPHTLLKIQQSMIKRWVYTKKIYSSWQNHKCFIHHILWLWVPIL